MFEYGSEPYPGILNTEIGEFLRAGKRLQKPATCPQSVYKLMMKCWKWEPQQRPNFVQVYEELQSALPRTEPHSARTTTAKK